MVVRKICGQGLPSEPTMRASVVVRRDARRQAMATRVDDFALARGATEPIASKQTAEHVWEPKFFGEIIAGRDPRVGSAAI